jgi:hypothetical protein
MNSIERRFQNGQPPHHHHDAQEITFTNQQSCIFLTTPEKMAQLTALQIQDIFRHRHILITGLASPESHFDRKELSRLGSLTAQHSIQGVYQAYIIVNMG